MISLPAEWVASLGPRLAAAARESLAADHRWGEILGPLLGRTVGRAWVGYASAETLRHVAAATPDDWENIASCRARG